VGGGSPAAARQRCPGSAAGAGRGAEGPTLVGDRQAALGCRHQRSAAPQGRAVGVRAAPHPAGDDREPCRPLRDRPPLALDVGGDEAGVGWAVDQFLFYGGYPGAAPLVTEPERWARYVRDSLIETTISRDVLLWSRVDKPALLRRLFELGCAYSGQILSYTKMLGQLQDAGNTTTLAHYLELLAGAGMLVGLQKYAAGAARQRGSSPKLQVLNTALMTAQSGVSLVDGPPDRRVTAIEVKSGRARDSFPGLAAIGAAHPRARKLLVGGDGIAVGGFLERPVEYWVAP
jgi:uncharacterized protein